MRVCWKFGCIAILMLNASQPFANPLVVHDLNPLTANFALPTLPAAPDHALSTNFSIGNISLDQAGGNEHVILDAERREWSLHYTRPISNAWTLRLDLPWVQIQGGTLDHFIEDWHHTFDLPNGNRADWPTNRLLIQHSVNGLTDLQATQRASGMGDLSLHLGKSWNQHSTLPVTAWLTVKIPTGNDNSLLGSGGMDIAISLSAKQQLTTWLDTFEQATLLHSGHTTWLRAQQQQWIASGMLGASLHLSSRWQFITQLNAHSPPYDSDIRALGNTMQLSLGPRYSAGRWQADFAITEDIAVDTAPDVQFVVQLARRW